MNPDFAALSTFQEHLNRYITYAELSVGEFDVLDISFQFLLPENLGGQVREIIGMVRRQGAPR